MAKMKFNINVFTKTFTNMSYMSNVKYVIYQFTCAGCKACYIGETKCHLNTRTEEHLGKDKKSHIYSHLQENLILIVLKL